MHHSIFEASAATFTLEKPHFIRNCLLLRQRITRIVPGPNDPTATNTYFFTEKPGSEFVASNCWNIVTKYPVVVQIKITGGSKIYNSDIRQFKMWTPNGDYL